VQGAAWLAGGPLQDTGLPGEEKAEEMSGSLLDNRRLRAIAPTLGLVFVFSGATMLVPCGIAIAEGGRDRVALLLSAGIAELFGVMLLGLFAHRKEDLRQRDAILAVVLSWLGVSALGALPYMLTGVLDPVDALFESISGFTTTGASVIAAIEDLPAGLLFWRSLTHWIGGMGILVLAIAVLPFLGSAGYQLFRAEAPALEQERLYPRMIQTARAMFFVYVLLTLLQAALLMLGEMSLFDALAHAFGTIATGGFSTRNASIGAFGSLYIEVVVIVFMVLGSIPFGVHHRGFRNPRAYLESMQVRVFVAVLSVACIAVACELWARGVYANLGDSFRYATFQVTTLMTTTGFATADSEQWTPFSQLVLILVMFIGGCTGSTAGGIKIFRFLVLGKLVLRQMFTLLHPRAVRPIRIGRQIVDEQVVQSAGVFFVMYLVVAFLGTFGLVAFGADGMTALTATVATLGGVGPGLGEVGPYDNYAWMPDGAKVICILLMLLGRLEIFTFAVVFTPSFWQRG
jgi:trk system potassium uptake protein